MKIQIKSIFENLIFEYDCENKTIRKTVEEAINQKVSLSGADLSGANLSGADLSGADLPMYCKWNHSIIDNKIRIGCKLHTIEEWDLFFKSYKVYETQRNTKEFKQIEAVYLAYKAYLTHLNL